MVGERAIELQTKTGEYLALGFTNGEILAQLVEECKISLKEAQAILRGVFNTWISVKEGLDLQAEDERNWHQYLRMQLLQKALANDTVPAQRLALMILDSIAGIQGISTMPEQIIPLTINLVEKPVEAVKTPIIGRGEVAQVPASATPTRIGE